MSDYTPPIGTSVLEVTVLVKYSQGDDWLTPCITPTGIQSKRTLSVSTRTPGS